jgi:hypothetical protein
MMAYIWNYGYTDKETGLGGDGRNCGNRGGKVTPAQLPEVALDIKRPTNLSHELPLGGYLEALIERRYMEEGVAHARLVLPRFAPRRGGVGSAAHVANTTRC